MLGLLLVLALTVGPISQDAALAVFTRLTREASEVLGVRGLTVQQAERIANVLLFVPLGVSTALVARRHPWRMAALLALLSLAVEVVQKPLADRDASLRDVALNAAGGALGVAIVQVVRRLQPALAPEVGEQRDDRHDQQQGRGEEP